MSISAWKLQTVKQKELKYIAQRNCMYKALFSGEELTRVMFFGSLPTEAAHTGHIVEAKEDISLNRCISSLLKG